MPSLQRPAFIRWRWQGDTRILFIFALYGLAASVMSYIASLSYDDSLMDRVTSAANFPAILTLFYVEWNMANPNGFSMLFHSAIIIAGSIVVWSFIGLLIYLFIKLGP